MTMYWGAFVYVSSEYGAVADNANGRSLGDWSRDLCDLSATLENSQSINDLDVG